MICHKSIISTCFSQCCLGYPTVIKQFGMGRLPHKNGSVAEATVARRSKKGGPIVTGMIIIHKRIEHPVF